MIIKRFEKQGDTYDIILMDYSMPVCNGSEATRAIRSYLSKVNVTKRPYIVCVTAYANPKFREDAKESGMDSYELKPILK